MGKRLRLLTLVLLATVCTGIAFAQEDAVYEDYTVKKKTYHIAISGAADLGLSVKWAACNVGAEKPEDDGEYYAWGETRDKSEWGYYDVQGYFDFTDPASPHFEKYSKTSKKEQLDDEDDVAHVKMGGTWHMPTEEEKEELTDNCKMKWITYKGKKGCLFIAKNGNAIFFPSAGIFAGSRLHGYGNDGAIWTKTRRGYPDIYAFALRFSTYGMDRTDTSRVLGLNVRGVTK